MDASGFDWDDFNKTLLELEGEVPLDVRQCARNVVDELLRDSLLNGEPLLSGSTNYLVIEWHRRRIFCRIYLSQSQIINYDITIYHADLSPLTSYEFISFNDTMICLKKLLQNK